MRRRDAFCASQASTAIFLTMDEPSSSSNAVQLGGKTIDRHNPIIRDHKRTPRTLPPLAPCTSQPPPINPKPYHLLHKNKKISFATEHSKKLSSKSKKLSSESAINDDEDAKKKKSDTEFTVSKDIATNTWIDQRRDFITPPGSSRYLLGESSRFYDGISNLDSGFGSIPDESNKAKILISEYESSASKTSSSRSEKPNSDQVVVLRVSLHCRGCEGKVRKHLSRMQGVTSFNIDFAAKKVTIVGDVTPLGVLASVSKVKNAKFWTPPTIDTATNLKIGLKK